MPGLECKCGHRISYTEIPCKDEWLVISDCDYDAFSGQVDAEDVFRAMTSMLKCPACGRLWVFWEGFGRRPSEYVPAGPEGLLS